MKRRVIRCRGAGGPEVLAVEEENLGPPAPDLVRVTVTASGINRADILQRRGVYPAPRGAPQDVLGLEFSGVVAETGARVMGLVPGGAMASVVDVDPGELLAVPEGMDLVAAAAVPEAFVTAFDALWDGLAPEKTMLVHAAASGVGTAAVQLGRLRGARVIGTSRSPLRLAQAMASGPFEPLVVTDGQFADAVTALTEGRGVDVVLDLVGAAYAQENLRALAIGGQIVTLGLVGGVDATFNLGQLVAKRAGWRGSVLRSRTLFERAALLQRFAADVLPAFSDGRLRPVVDDVVAPDAIADAHRRLEANEIVGKLLVRW